MKPDEPQPPDEKKPPHDPRFRQALTAVGAALGALAAVDQLRKMSAEDWWLTIVLLAIAAALSFAYYKAILVASARAKVLKFLETRKTLIVSAGAGAAVSILGFTTAPAVMSVVSEFRPTSADDNIANPPTYKGEMSLGGTVEQPEFNSETPTSDSVPVSQGQPNLPLSLPVPEVRAATIDWLSDAYAGIEEPIVFREPAVGEGYRVPSIQQVNALVGLWCGVYGPVAITTSNRSLSVHYPTYTEHGLVFVKTAIEGNNYVHLRDDGIVTFFEFNRDESILKDRKTWANAQNSWTRC